MNMFGAREVMCTCLEQGMLCEHVWGNQSCVNMFGVREVM